MMKLVASPGPAVTAFSQTPQLKSDLSKPDSEKTGDLLSLRKSFSDLNTNYQRRVALKAMQDTPIEFHTRIFDEENGKNKSARSEMRSLGKDGSLGRIFDLHGKELASDGHMHPTNYSQRGAIPREILVLMDEIGKRNTTLMPIPTTVISPIRDKFRMTKGAHHCGEAYYIPEQYKNIRSKDMTLDVRAQIVKGVELSMDTGVDASAAFRLKNAKLTEAEMSRFDPMITGLHLGNALSTNFLLQKLYENKGIFTGIGEVTLHKELVDQMFAGNAQANLSDNIGSFKDLVGVAGIIGMPVVLHCDVDSLENQARRGASDYRPSNLEGLKKLFSDPQVMATNVIWSHAGGLGRFVTEPDGHQNELRFMLDKFPKLNIDISWARVAEQLDASPETRQRWQAFLEKNNSRIIFGSDTLAPSTGEKWNETREIYKGLFDGLTDQTRANILNNNYDRLFVGARSKVREFEESVLTPDFYETKLMANDAPRVTAEWLAEYATLKLATKGAAAVQMISSMV